MEIITHLNRIRTALVSINMAVFGFVGLQAQNTISDSIILMIELNKQECPLDTSFTTTEACDNRWIIASELLDRYYFTNDTVLSDYLDFNSGYIINKYRKKPSRNTFWDPGSMRYMRAQIESFNYSIRLHSRPPEVQFDSAVYNHETFLMKYFARTFSINQLIQKAINNKNAEYLSGLYSNVLKYKNDEDIPIFYSGVIDSTLNDSEHYMRLIVRLKKCKTYLCDSIFQREYLRFDSIKDLTKNDDRVLWEDIFNRGREIRDSLRFIEFIKWQDHYDDSIRQEFIKEQLRPVTEVEYIATLDSSGLRRWKVMNDTTLWYTGNIYSGDDGTNFLVWSNDSLLAKIKSFNLDSLYNMYVNKHPTAMFKVPELFYLWKTTQVIGDRILDGSLVLQEEDSIFLNNMIQYYADVHSDTAYLFTEMQIEAKNQLLRLWPLLTPHFYNWINTPGIYYRFLAIELMASCFTEEMVLYLVDKIDHPTNEFEQSMKFKYFEVLSLLYGIKDPRLEQFNYTIPPRRPTRTFQQTQDWIDRHIEPLRTRHKLPPID